MTLLGSDNTMSRQHAKGVLVRLSIESANRALIIEQLVAMLAEDSPSAQEQAAAALANLASESSENRVSIVDAGGELHRIRAPRSAPLGPSSPLAAALHQALRRCWAS